MSDNKVYDSLKALTWDGREHLLGLLTIAQRASMDNVASYNIRRQFHLADQQLKRCNPDYEPLEDDDMGSPVFINAGVMASDETLNSLVNSMAESGQSKGEPATATADPPVASEPPEPGHVRPTPRPIPDPPKPAPQLDLGALWTSMPTAMKWGLGGLLLLGLGNMGLGAYNAFKSDEYQATFEIDSSKVRQSVMQSLQGGAVSGTTSTGKDSTPPVLETP